MARASRRRGGSDFATFEAARRLALALPATEEAPSYGTPGFRVRGKLFLRFHQDGEAWSSEWTGPSERCGCGPIPRPISSPTITPRTRGCSCASPPSAGAGFATCWRMHGVALPLRD